MPKVGELLIWIPGKGKTEVTIATSPAMESLLGALEEYLIAQTELARARKELIEREVGPLTRPDSVEAPNG